jgi:hypothetical protein
MKQRIAISIVGLLVLIFAPCQVSRIYKEDYGPVGKYLMGLIAMVVLAAAGFVVLYLLFVVIAKWLIWIKEG